MTHLNKLSPTHESIMDWILLNPGANLRECAAAFGYTPQGIGYIVNSDLFKAKLRERRNDIELLIAADIPSKLNVLASLAVERTTEVLQNTSDPETIVDIFDKTLHRLGYAPSKGPGLNVTFNQQNNNNYQASAEDIAQAQAVILQAGRAVPLLIPPLGGPTDPNSGASDEPAA